MNEMLRQISPVIWEIPVEYNPMMKVPALIYCSEKMLRLVEKDKSIQQLINVTTLPGIQCHAIVMPDVHEGYGFPIGAVAAIDADDGVISPGGIGYDINCGVRLLKSELVYNEIKTKIEKLASQIYQSVPSGVGKGGALKLGKKDMDAVLREGVKWTLDHGYAEPGDMDFIESGGSLAKADCDAVSSIAKDRGRNQLGTMGAGNHFVEIDVVNKIYDPVAAEAFGLSENQIVLQIHTGSRGLGHQVATDFIREMISSMKAFGFHLPDRELSCAPIKSKIGTDYFGAMCASANFAWANRQLITYEIREAWKTIFGGSGGRLSILYDVAHNIAKIEEHVIEGIKKNVIVHRKGATRAYPAGHPELPYKYRSVGQPVLIPGSMGTSSYVLVGLEKNMEATFGSTCHGAGRVMSRTAARKKIDGGELRDQLVRQGIVVQTGSLRGLSEEAPDAYKDVDSVVDVVEQAGIARKVARLVPLAVIKG